MKYNQIVSCSNLQLVTKTIISHIFIVVKWLTRIIKQMITGSRQNGNTYKALYATASDKGRKLPEQINKYSLLSVVRRRRYCNYSQALHRYDNLLNRDFHADRPNQKWVTDISYIKTSQGFLYLSVIRDLYDSSIAAYKTSTVQNINLVLNTIRAAKRKEKVTGELQLHSDQDFQYTSHGYFKLIQSYNIIPSMKRRGKPYDNALAEKYSLFSEQSAFTGQRSNLLQKRDSSLMIISTFTIISVSS